MKKVLVCAIGLVFLLAVFAFAAEKPGEIITLGSDAHEKVRIGEKFEEMSEYLKKFGFKYLAYYKKRKVNFYKID